jgi:hypothetical protein
VADQRSPSDRGLNRYDVEACIGRYLPGKPIQRALERVLAILRNAKVVGIFQPLMVICAAE